MVHGHPFRYTGDREELRSTVLKTTIHPNYRSSREYQVGHEISVHQHTIRVIQAYTLTQFHQSSARSQGHSRVFVLFSGLP